MAVTQLNDWTGFEVNEPNGSLSISAGSNRGLFVVYIAEVAGTFTYNSITVGTVAPTSTNIYQSTTSSEQYIWLFYWDKDAIASMSGTTVAFSSTGTVTKHVWDYTVLAGITGGVEFATAVEESSSADTSITLANPSTSDDYVIVIVNRSSANRDVTGYDNLTEAWQYNTNFTAAIADGVGGDDTITLTGDGLAGDWSVLAVHLKTATNSLLQRMMYEGHMNG